MRINAKERLTEMCCVVGLLMLVYYMVASVRFALVHPYATKTQQMFHFKDVIMWKKVPAKEFIPKD